MTNKGKSISIICFMVLVILLSGFGAFKETGVAKNITSVEQLSKGVLGGVVSRMPNSSAKLMFEGLTGQKLSAYKTFKSVDNTVAALKNGGIDAAWFCDVTARYVMAKEPSLKLLDHKGMSDNMNLGDSDGDGNSDNRFDLGMAFKNDDRGQALAGLMNTAFEALEESGRMKLLRDFYIDFTQEPVPFYEEDMFLHRADAFSEMNMDTIYVGVTGAIEPVEMIDNEGRPYGFCCAFMDEVGQYIMKDIQFVVLDNETAFTSLMSGRVDALFCYGTGRITTEGTKKYVMTNGYYSVGGYEFVSCDNNLANEQ